MAKEEKKITKDVNRGTQDECEVIMMIMAENLAVRTAVMERIKQAKNRMAQRSRSGASDGPQPSKKAE